MRPGELLEALDDFMITQNFYKFLADHKPGSWKTLDVNYEPPQVHRMWVQHGDYRVNLHRIFPCKMPIYHPHPWPSVILVLDGEYEMGVGTEDVEAARVVPTVVMRCWTPRVGTTSSLSRSPPSASC